MTRYLKAFLLIAYMLFQYKKTELSILGLYISISQRCENMWEVGHFALLFTIYIFV